MISARPLDTASKVENLSYTLTGSSEDKTVTADDNLMCCVLAAA